VIYKKIVDDDRLGFIIVVEEDKETLHRIVTYIVRVMRSADLSQILTYKYKPIETVKKNVYIVNKSNKVDHLVNLS